MSWVISGATIIDGKGGALVKDGTIVVDGERITSVGGRYVAIPPSARRIDARGKYVIPGLIDTNVHLDFKSKELFQLLVYGDEESYFKCSLALEGAQVALKHGVTTILDTYGPLLPLLKLRDRINSGELAGPRLLVGGNIIGWDGPLSPSESKRKAGDIKRWEHNYNTWFTQGTGACLAQMYADEVTKAITRYLDLGPDFIKIGVTTHDIVTPITLTFSPRILRAIVDTAHARGLKVQAHSGTVEGHRQCVDNGVDIITHAESLYSQRLRPDFAKQLAEGETSFALFAHASLPPYEYLRQEAGYRVAAATAAEKVRVIEAVTPDRDRSRNCLPPALESKLPGADDPLTAFRKQNQETLIKAGGKIIVATDSHPAPYEDLVGHSRMHPDMGIGTLDAIEGLVTLGMTPMHAIESATRHAAVATGLGDRIGTIEEGKLADLVVLDSNPLENIRNLRSVHRVVRNGIVHEPGSLPVVPKFYKR